MEWFSGKYKKMCEKAEIIQNLWKPVDWEYYCKKGDYKDGDVLNQVHLGLIKEPIDQWKENHVWLLTETDLLERVIPVGVEKLNQLRIEKCTKYVYEENKQIIEESSNKDDIIRILTLKFAMKWWGFEWDEEKEEWVRK